MKVLHLIDPGWPGGGGSVLRCLAGGIGALDDGAHTVLVLGTTSHAQIALQCGVESIGSVAVRSGRAVSRIVRGYERVHGHYDIVHSWTERAAVIATSSLRGHGHVVSVTPGSASERLVARLAEARARVLAPFESTRSEYESLGAAARLIDVVPPGLALHAEGPDAGDRVRRQWGSLSDNGADRSFIVALLADDVRRVDADAAMSIAARLTISGKRVRAVVHPDAHRRAEAELNSHHIGFEDEILIVDDDVAEPWRIAAGLSAAIQISPATRSAGGAQRGPGGLVPLLWTMAAGLPVIAEDAGAGREVIEDGVSGFLIPPGDINAACDRIDRLCDDPKLAQRLGEEAARCVRDRFSPDAFRDGLMRAYLKAMDT